MKPFDYSKFLNSVHDAFKTEVSLEKVKEWLDLEDDYNKDSPTSLGKSLQITRLTIAGNKNNGDIIKYDQSFSKGLTTWIADNGHGKSSIFKIIKYCLTGSNSLKKDVKSWLKEIKLEFIVGGNLYFIYINKQNKVSEGAMYSLSIDEFDQLSKAGKDETIEKKRQFYFKGDDSLGNHLQTFFFNQFSFYALKYTSKSSAKDDLTLKTANLSWSTYFKTIYLQSSEHEFLFLSSDFGNQSAKIFEMILGLRLTYPINRLTVLMNLEDEKIGKLRLVDSISTKSAPDLSNLEKELGIIGKRIRELEEGSLESVDTKHLISEQIRIQAIINEKLFAYRTLYSRIQEDIKNIDKFKNEISNFEYDQDMISAEVNRLSKQVINMETYRDIEGFFTNLEITTCPHCENDKLQERFVEEKTAHKCGLCGSTDLLTKVDVEEINGKIEDIQLEVKSLNSRFLSNKSSIDQLVKSIEDLTQLMNTQNEKYHSGPDIEEEQAELEIISSKLEEVQAHRQSRKEAETELEKLKDKRAILKYRLEEKDQPHNTIETNETEIGERGLKRQVYAYAINLLKSTRQSLNQELLTKLEGLILTEVQAFGLNVTKVTITDNYRLSFLQNGEIEEFEELNESEKLRAKFAFYLSLIQLDIEYKLGRHPRFLIIDSPGSEEISKNNLSGLSSIFKQVGSRFGEELQIFIGTTLVEFSTATSGSQTFVKKNKEFVF